MWPPSASRISSRSGDGLLLQQGGRREDEARRAEAALGGVVLVEGGLHAGEVVGRADALQRDDRRALDVDDRRQAGAARLAVDQDGARAAAALLAAGLGGRQPELLAQDLQQGRQRVARRWPARRRSRPASRRLRSSGEARDGASDEGRAGCGRGTSRTRARRRAAAGRRAPPRSRRRRAPRPRRRTGGRRAGRRRRPRCAGRPGRRRRRSPTRRGWCRCGRAAGRSGRSRSGRPPRTRSRARGDRPASRPGSPRRPPCARRRRRPSAPARRARSAAPAGRRAARRCPRRRRGCRRCVAALRTSRSATPRAALASGSGPSTRSATRVIAPMTTRPPSRRIPARPASRSTSAVVRAVPAVRHVGNDDGAAPDDRDAAAVAEGVDGLVLGRRQEHLCALRHGVSSLLLPLGPVAGRMVHTGTRPVNRNGAYATFGLATCQAVLSSAASVSVSRT